MLKRFLIVLTILVLLNLLLNPLTLSSNISEMQTQSDFRSIFAAYPIINLTYAEVEENLVPNSGVLDIPIYITMRLGGNFVNLKERLLNDYVLNIDLSIEEKPSWCTASLSNKEVQLSIIDPEPYQTTLTVTVNENAPAFKQNNVIIKATSPEVSGLFFTRLEAVESSFEISFIVGYWSVVSYDMPKGTIMKISPYETADFEINIENIGNGPTFVKIELIDEPKKGWSANIASSVQLASATDDGMGTRKTVHLRIKSPFEPGYHNEMGSFRVKFTPSYLGRPDLVGSTEIITFNVKSVGNVKDVESENFLLLILITVIFLIIIITFFLKRRFQYK